MFCRCINEGEISICIDLRSISGVDWESIDPQRSRSGSRWKKQTNKQTNKILRITDWNKKRNSVKRSTTKREQLGNSPVYRRWCTRCGRTTTCWSIGPNRRSLSARERPNSTAPWTTHNNNKKRHTLEPEREKKQTLDLTKLTNEVKKASRLRISSLLTDQE